ncbi:MAG: hydroxymyristoyl-ACP dehydratase [Clostridiales bacterium]|nr:hydroxymyristoyl-ACP dehydratase [Clostridiales bacterium]MDR2749204.1 hydroxymyristoyl-ACP dehydratase [Clostridiales bacterium]
MDINCTNECVYQTDGKCTLDRLPSMSNQLNYSTDTDCPYCAHRGGALTLS